MFPIQAPRINSNEFSRCEERRQIRDREKSLSPSQKTDAAIKEYVYQAFWKDDVLRAIEYSEIDVHVKNGVVYLSGHIVSTTSQMRIENAMRSISGILGIQNNLVLDDKLTLEVAASLGRLEHIYSCKFFTGASHGVLSLGGNVSDESVKLLAEKCAASNANVRAVINNVRVSGAQSELQDQPFLQPAIGEIIYFRDGISGVVKQVVINPNNRRVVAMTLLGRLADQQQELKSFKNGEARSPERLVVVPVGAVRYMTGVSGFLYIKSSERNRYLDLDPTNFFTPNKDWKAPYPYCPEDILFPVEHQHEEKPASQRLPGSSLAVAQKEQLLWEELLANESLGG
ncbi:MAG TPA: BON domain-containing protein [Anaerolineales bacterium]|nr:BON domain-containing protein [Anaerolineales bacterium]